jgi:hypothetical protein
LDLEGSDDETLYSSASLRQSTHLLGVLKLNSFTKVAFNDADDEESECSLNNDELQNLLDDDLAGSDEGEDVEVDLLVNLSTNLLSPPRRRKSTILKLFVDKIGLTRIGPQPHSPAVQVKWSPKNNAIVKIREVVETLYHV